MKRFAICYTTIVILWRFNVKEQIFLIIIIIPFINLLFLYFFVYCLLCELLCFLSVFVALVLFFHHQTLLVSYNIANYWDRQNRRNSNTLPPYNYFRQVFLLDLTRSFYIFCFCLIFDTLTDLLC